MGVQFSRSLKQNSQFRRLYHRGKSATGRCLVIYCRPHEAEFRPGYHMVIVARTRAVRASYGELEQALLSLAGQLGLLKAAPAAQPAKEPEAHA